MKALGVVGEGLVELGLEPEPDRTVTLGFGGDVANTAVMAALLGTPARLAGRVGADALGRRLVAFWESRGIDVSHVIADVEAPTGLYVNERGSEGPHRFDYHRRQSAGSRLAPPDIDDAFLDGLGALHVSGITLAVSASSHEAGQEAMRRARAAGALVSLAVNHRPSLGGDPAALVAAAASADVVFMSDEEAAALGLPQAYELVLTRGAAGAAVRVAGSWHEAGVLPVVSVDAAGAGDALAGAYLARRLAGADPATALRAGVAAASLSCRARGCALSYPTAEEVERALGGDRDEA